MSLSKSRAYFKSHHIFVTGATGFLGLAFIVKICHDTPCSQLWLLVRGGEKRFWELCRESLPWSAYASLRQHRQIEILDGDMQKPQLGLSQHTVDLVKATATIYVHAASSINLSRPLPSIAASIVAPSLDVAEIALDSPRLERFVYISTAYSNAHLHRLHTGIETVIGEHIDPLGQDPARSVNQEYEDLNTLRVTPEFKENNFPFPYAYAKNLTERLLLDRFASQKKTSFLLVVRPSIIGPAVCDPFPYYEIRGSAPATSFCAALLACPSFTIKIASRFPDPAHQSTFDEVPVDIVVNRILAHLSYGSSGCVHAVAGKPGRRSFAEIWDKAMGERRLPWTPRLVWLDVGWEFDGLHLIARALKILGTSFLFEDRKVEDLWRCMGSEDKDLFPLWLDSAKRVNEKEMRKKAVERQLRRWFLRQGIPRLFVTFMITLLVKPSQKRRWLVPIIMTALFVMTHQLIVCLPIMKLSSFRVGHQMSRILEAL